jgi:hypothetical protein
VRQVRILVFSLQPAVALGRVETLDVARLQDKEIAVSDSPVSTTKHSTTRVYVAAIVSMIRIQ